MHRKNIFGREGGIHSTGFPVRNFSKMLLVCLFVYFVIAVVPVTIVIVVVIVIIIIIIIGCFCWCIQSARVRFACSMMNYTVETHLAMKGTCIASLYNSVAILVASPMLRQSISQKRADTVVVKDTQSLTNVRGVEPVTSSHWARVVPPDTTTGYTYD